MISRGGLKGEGGLSTEITEFGDSSLSKGELVPKINWLTEKFCDRIRLCKYIVIQLHGWVR